MDLSQMSIEELQALRQQAQQQSQFKMPAQVPLKQLPEYLKAMQAMRQTQQQPQMATAGIQLTGNEEYDKALMKKQAETDVSTLMEARESLPKFSKIREDLQRAKALNPKAAAGAAAGVETWLSRNIGGGETAAASTELNSILTEQALTQLKAIFGGNPTEGERKILLQLQGSPEMSEKERTALISRIEEAVKSREDQAANNYKRLTGQDYQLSRPSTPSSGSQIKRLKYNPQTGDFE